MEEIREVALAYYHNLSDDVKSIAYQTFRELDSNGDGTITIDELVDTSDPQAMKRSIFRELDTNGDGKLDFEEFITLFYLFMSERGVGCDGIGCKVNLIKGVYFTCVDCFDRNKATTYDLCVSCYRYKNYVHPHGTFLDAYSLLRSKAECCADDRPISSAQPSQVKRSGSRTQAALAVANGLNVGVNFGQAVVSVASTGCSIM